MNKIILVITLFFSSLLLPAQPTKDSSWKKSGFIGLKMTQVSLSSWSAGGESALAFDAQFMYSADYKKGSCLWQNRLELSYGLSQSEDQGARKTNDKIYMASTFGYQIYKTFCAC